MFFDGKTNKLLRELYAIVMKLLNVPSRIRRLHHYKMFYVMSAVLLCIVVLWVLSFALCDRYGSCIHITQDCCAGTSTTMQGTITWSARNTTNRDLSCFVDVSCNTYPLCQPVQILLQNSVNMRSTLCCNKITCPVWVGLCAFCVVLVDCCPLFSSLVYNSGTTFNLPMVDIVGPGTSGLAKRLNKIHKEW